MRRLYCGILLFVLVFSLTGCQKEPMDYPNRDITVIIPFEAGGGIDISGRSLLTELDGVYDGVKFIPTNITGASGTIGATELYYADNDGYTLLVGGNGMNVAHISNNFELTYADYQLVSQFVVSTPGLFVRSDSPYQTYEEFIAAAQEDGAIKMGVVTGTVNHYATLGIEDATGVEFQKIIIGGDQPQQPELLSGRVDAYVIAVSQNTAYLESGDFRCLGVFADQRLESMPDVPTFQELGIDDDYQLFFGLWAPAGTSADVIDTLNVAVETVCNNPDFIQTMETMGYTVEYGDDEAYTARMAASLDNIIALSEKMGLDNDNSIDPYNDPYTVPTALVIAILVLGLLEIARKKYQKEPFKPTCIGLFKGNIPPFILSLFLFALIFEHLGYALSSTLYLTVMILYLRKSVYPHLSVKLVAKTAGLSAVFAVVSYLFFTQVAGIVMPVSPLGIL